jgi:hypothetical protein
LLLQLIADRPDVVTRAVVASAAYALGPVAKQDQRDLMESIERTGRFSGAVILAGCRRSRPRPWSPTGRATSTGRCRWWPRPRGGCRGPG